MRTFQFSDVKSHKFWSIEVKDTYYQVNFGKVGSAGQIQRKTFATAAEAQAEMDKLIKEKLKKGYVETTPKASISEEESFHKALVENPADLAGWCAFADYLVEHDDPRGEFMQTQIALEDEKLSKTERTALKKKEAELLKEHQETFLGALAPFLLNPPKPKPGWRQSDILFAFHRGWLADLEIPSLQVEFVRMLNRAPEARFLRKLHIHQNAYEQPEGANVPDWVDGTYKPGPDLPKGGDEDQMASHLLVRCPHLSAVRVFHLGNPLAADGIDDSDQCHTQGDVAFHCVKQMPHVEEVRLLAHNVDTNKLFALPMPKLRILQVFHASSYPVAKLTLNASLTNLTHLLLQPHAPDEDQPYLRLRELRLICRSTCLPNLTHLALRYTDFGDEGVKELIASGMLKRLKVLDLLGGCVTDDGAKLLAADTNAQKLERLNLDTNALSGEGLKALKKAGINATAANQHGSVPPFDDGLPEYLFYADIE
jgi:uncharacterized protein (TIGR02996 family)